MVLKNLIRNKDIIYNSFWLKKFLNSLQIKHVYFLNLVKYVKYKHRYEVIFLFFEIIELIKPTLFTVKKLRGKNKLEIPIMLTQGQQYKKAILWLVKSLKSRKEKVLLKKFYYEFFSIIKKQSNIFILHRILNKKLLRNRAFQHYRWR